MTATECPSVSSINASVAPTRPQPRITTCIVTPPYTLPNTGGVSTAKAVPGMFGRGVGRIPETESTSAVRGAPPGLGIDS